MPSLDMACKLVYYDGHPVMKLSTGKATPVDQKQVWKRTVDGSKSKTSLPCGANRLSQVPYRCCSASCALAT